MSKTYYKLNIDINDAINEKFDFLRLYQESEESIKLNHWNQWYFSTNDLSNLFTHSWLNYLKSINLELQHAYIFYRSPLINFDPHVDTQKDSEFSIAINWVLYQDNSNMVWYTVKDNSIGYQTVSPTNKSYTSWKVDDLIEVDRICIGNQPTLVRVDIPHNIEVKDQPRWCIGIRTKRRVKSWQEQLGIMEKYIIK